MSAVRRILKGETSLQDAMESMLSSFFTIGGGRDICTSIVEEAIPVTLLKSDSDLKECVSQ